VRSVEGELWVMDADGGGKRLLALNARGASWSPDGRAVAFVRRVA
jgi:Tol biopolymer transport system component